jgi:hypothetical protein
VSGPRSDRRPRPSAPRRAHGRAPAAAGTFAALLACAALLASLAGCGTDADQPDAAAASAPRAATDGTGAFAQVRPPDVAVTTAASGTARGYLFAAPKRGPKGDQAGPMIFDDRGQAVWFHPLSGGMAAYGFSMQTYRGKPVLTWWQGIPHDGFGTGVDVIYDDHYQPIATVKAGNGLSADLHEFQITKRGTALLLAYVPQRRDMRRWGGRANQLVVDQAVQEIDIATGRVLLDWRGLQHVSPDESYMGPPRNPAKYWDPLHLNSIDVDRDGNLLVSARDSHATYKIDRHSGRIIWKMGGKDSDFTMGRGTRTRWQHDARRLPDGHLTWFDNNAVRPTSRPTQSRGLEVAVDPSARRVRLVRAYRHRPAELSTSQANMQTLPNGDKLIGWGGGQPNLTEYSPTGQVRFEARFTGAGTDSYRAFRWRWTGRPDTLPQVAPGPGAGQVLARWNGATEVASWRVLAGRDDATLQPTAERPRTGFDTSLAVPADATRVVVVALDAQGRELRRSAPLDISS